MTMSIFADHAYQAGEYGRCAICAGPRWDERHAQEDQATRPVFAVHYITAVGSEATIHIRASTVAEFEKVEEAVAALQAIGWTVYDSRYVYGTTAIAVLRNP